MRIHKYLTSTPRPAGRFGAHSLQGASRSSDAGSGGFSSDGDDQMGGDDGRGWTRGRKFSAEDLHLMLLGLLEEKPSHGYELIKAIGARSNGFYTPSPGVVYPALTYLEELGYTTIEADGSKKRYHLAPLGLAQLEANRDRLATLMNKLRHISHKMEWMRRAWRGQQPELGADGQDLATGWLPEFVAARQALKAVLLERTDASPAEQRRIIDILQRATAEIKDAACS